MTAATLPYVVLIAGPNHTRTWGKYPDRKAANDIVLALRRHGFDARVIGPDDLPLEQAKP